MAMRKGFEKRKSVKKKTRQGASPRTKKNGVKLSRGQGGPKRRKR